MPYGSLQPELWIIAGANGSGKSTAYEYLRLISKKDSIWIINPDILSKTIEENEKPENANLMAVQRIEEWLYASIKTYQTVGVETVLASEKYKNLVELAKERKFKINFIYVYLDDVSINIERVKNRVLNGGHDVPEDKIRERRLKSIANMAWFIKNSDFAIIINNSGANLTMEYKKDSDSIEISEKISDEIIKSLRTEFHDL